MQLELTGIITDIFPAEIFGNFEKRVFWVKEIADNYPNHWAFEMQQGFCNKLDKYNRGDVVTCKIEVKGKRYEKNGKASIFNVLKCVNITMEQPNKPAAKAADIFPGADTDGGSLPF